MYNIYVYEKKEREKKEQEKKAKSIERYKKKFNSIIKYLIQKIKIEQIGIMYENYENRVKNFITEVK